MGSRDRISSGACFRSRATSGASQAFAALNNAVLLMRGGYRGSIRSGHVHLFIALNSFETARAIIGPTPESRLGHGFVIREGRRSVREFHDLQEHLRVNATGKVYEECLLHVR